MKLTNKEKILVGDEAVLLARANPNRKAINIWAGAHPLHYGGDQYLSNDPALDGKVETKGRVTLENITGEVWVRREAFQATHCTFDEELANG